MTSYDLLAITGASGIRYAIRLLECLLMAGRQVHVVISPAACEVAQKEMDWTIPVDEKAIAKSLIAGFSAAPRGNLRVFSPDDWSAPMASGSNPPQAMVVCPCSMGTLAAIAHGMSNNLIERAADVVLKEKKNLILVPRETPLSIIHLENMLRLAKAGAIILPPSPGFYAGSEKVEDLIDFVVARILDQIGVTHSLHVRWGNNL